MLKTKKSRKKSTQFNRKLEQDNVEVIHKASFKSTEAKHTKKIRQSVDQPVPKRKLTFLSYAF